jgi:uncharacterized membrane protein
MIRALFLSLLLSPAALSASFDVTGVEWGDVLNIRKSPSAKAALAGAIPYDGRDVEKTGTAAKGWVRVKYRGIKGYVLAKYLAPTVPEGPLPATLKCHGTEPFWNAEFSAKGATFEHMSDGKTKIDIGSFEQTSNRSNSWMAMGPNAAASLTSGQRCSNGMSDDVFPYSLHMSTPASGIVSGCCK